MRIGTPEEKAYSRKYRLHERGGLHFFKSTSFFFLFLSSFHLNFDIVVWKPPFCAWYLPNVSKTRRWLFLILRAWKMWSLNFVNTTRLDGNKQSHVRSRFEQGFLSPYALSPAFENPAPTALRRTVLQAFFPTKLFQYSGNLCTAKLAVERFFFSFFLFRPLRQTFDRGNQTNGICDTIRVENLKYACLRLFNWSDTFRDISRLQLTAARKQRWQHLSVLVNMRTIEEGSPFFLCRQSRVWKLYRAVLLESDKIIVRARKLRCGLWQTCHCWYVPVRPFFRTVRQFPLPLNVSLWLQGAPRLEQIIREIPLLFIIHGASSTLFQLPWRFLCASCLVLWKAASNTWKERNSSFLVLWSECTISGTARKGEQKVSSFQAGHANTLWYSGFRQHHAVLALQCCRI